MKILQEIQAGEVPSQEIRRERLADGKPAVPTKDEAGGYEFGPEDRGIAFREGVKRVVRRAARPMAAVALTAFGLGAAVNGVPRIGEMLDTTPDRDARIAAAAQAGREHQPVAWGETLEPGVEFFYLPKDYESGTSEIDSHTSAFTLETPLDVRFMIPATKDAHGWMAVRMPRDTNYDTVEDGLADTVWFNEADARAKGLVIDGPDLRGTLNTGLMGEDFLKNPNSPVATSQYNLGQQNELDSFLKAANPPLIATLE